ncbi:MAG: hypothetical protein ACHREM_10185, partial [Polyangiales bacterium]
MRFFARHAGHAWIRRLALCGLTSIGTASCATGGTGTGGNPDDGLGDGTTVDGSLSDGSIDASTETDESGDGAADTLADIFLGDATVLDLLGVCVQGTGGPSGPCDPSNKIDFGSVGATDTQMRLVRIDDRGIAGVSILNITTDSPQFKIATEVYTVDATGKYTKTTQTLPYLIPAGQSLWAEVSISGTGTVGPLPANVLRVTAQLGVNPSGELDVPITGTLSSCPPGRASCDPDPTKVCTTDVANDLNNCGGCGTICSIPHGTPSCVAGKCTNLGCDTNYVDCDGSLLNGCETNVFNDLHHCGACTTDCTHANTSEECSGGNCKVDSCQPGYADCNLSPADGCETDVQTSPTNCGGCNLNCAYANAGSQCSKGVCQYLGCDPGYVDCNLSLSDGCEAAVQTDPKNCGGCGNTCSYTNGVPICVVGSCALGSCNANFQNCDGSTANGCESYAPTDIANCGACGNNCAKDYPHSKVDCQASACVDLGCDFGYFDKDGDPTNGCEYGDPTLLLQLCVLNKGGPTGVCVTPPILDFGSLAPGDTALRRYRYTNIAADDITVDNVSIASAAFSPAPLKYLFDSGTGTYAPLPVTLPIVLHPGDALYFEVTLNAGTASGTIPATQVQANAHMLSEPQVTLVVSMQGNELGCPAGTSHCSATGSACETNISGDVNNCGGCGITCSAANASVSCVGGICQMGACAPGFADCNLLAADGCEVNLKTNGLNCGTCGNICTGNNAAEACVAGSCSVTACTAPWADCNGLASDGCETDTSSSTNNCSACADKCAPANAAGACVTSACTIGTCNPGYQDCDTNPVNGCEINTAGDASNCGTCGNLCTYPNAGALCTAGVCGLGACNAGFQNCNAIASDGCEDYVPSDPLNCGACGHDCNTVYPHSNVGCGSSSCTWTSCAAGYLDKNGSLTDGCEYASPTLMLALCVENDLGPTGTCASSKSLDFGSILPGSTLMRLFKLTNTGDQTISIDKVTTDAPAFGEVDVAYVTLPDGTLSRTVVTLPYTVPPGGSFYVESSILGTAASGALPATKVRVTTHIGTESSEEIDVPITGNMPGCAPGTASCDGIDSNGCEVNTNNDLGNCGGCSKVCAYANATTQCSGGSCALTGCTGTYNDCNGNPLDGCESNYESDPTNCGGCKNSCAVSNTITQCTGGSCGIVSCAPGYRDCDTVEANGCEVQYLGSDLNNCGGCSVLCAPPNATPICNVGSCAVLSCTGNYLDCNGLVGDGCEVDGSSNPNHCGACSTKCSYANATPLCNSKVCAMGSCNSGYTDCNSSSTDGCEIHTASDINHCGGCSNDCTVTYPNATVSCTGSTPACVWDSCSTGWVDLHGDHTCSYACTYQSAIDLPDLGFVDANCDGIDGDIALAIFVSPFGNDGAAGTMAAPVKTLAHALSLASSASPKKNVYADKGIYAESVTLTSGIGIYGGYDSSTTWWGRAASNASTIQSPTTTGVFATGVNASTTVQLMTIVSASASAAASSSYAVQVISSPGPVVIDGCTLYAGSGGNGVDYSGIGAASSGANGSPSGYPGTTQTPGYTSCPQGAVNGGGGANSVSGQTSGNAGGLGGSVSGGGAPGAKGSGGSKYGVCGSSGTSGDTGGGGGTGGTGSAGPHRQVQRCRFHQCRRRRRCLPTCRSCRRHRISNRRCPWRPEHHLPKRCR